MKTDNQIIAEFMGLQVYQTSEEMRAVPLEDLREWAYIDQIDYDTSWASLMPVVEKIDSLMPSISIPDDLAALKDGTHGSEPYIDVLALPLSTPIMEAHSKVVHFIKWYNENKS